MSDITFRASSVGKCAAQLYRDAVSPAVEDPTESDMELFLLMGHSTQSALSYYLSLFGVNILESETHYTQYMSGRGFHLSGHVDSVIDYGQARVIGEMKALKHANYLKIHKQGWAEIYPHYYDQVQVYMDLAGLSDAIMFFVDRDNHKKNLIHGMLDVDMPCGTYYKDLWVKRSDTHLDGLYDRLEGVAHAVLMGTPLPCDKKKGRCWDCFPSNAPSKKGLGRKPMTGEQRVASHDAARDAMEALHAAKNA